MQWLLEAGAYLAGALLSLLPPRYRRAVGWLPEVHFQKAAFLSGLLQSLGCLIAIIFRYLFFFQHRVMDLGGQVIARGAEEALGAKSVQFAMGFTTTIEYIFHPVTLLLIYFALEGAVRFVAALVTGEIVGTLPLYAVGWAHGRLAGWRAERALGPRIPDTVERGDGREFDFHIASCRPKANWDRLMTIAYDEQLYEVVKEERSAPPRPFVYLLRRIPEGKVIRGLHRYRPDEVLHEPGEG
ncbi:MAG: hypothetical protein HYY26_01035 [Acidobacteria bacterium]|nr:hypothetical protein [Acidobacteriota bacterium]